jgi:hypothetical protein
MNKKSMIIIGLVVVLALVSWWFNRAEASRYHNNVTNITNNTYVDKSSEAMGACALGTAQAQIHPTIDSKHHQWGIGAGFCEGDTEEKALALGYARQVSKGPKHYSLINFSLGRSSDEVTSIGAGFNWHY